MVEHLQDSGEVSENRIRHRVIKSVNYCYFIPGNEIEPPVVDWSKLLATISRKNLRSSGDNGIKSNLASWKFGLKYHLPDDKENQWCHLSVTLKILKM